MVRLNVNGRMVEVAASPDTPLLWALREQIGLTGTKYGCGIAQCGACTVHVDGQPVRACSMPISAFTANQKIITIEGLSPDGMHPVQVAWRELDVPQCGYCQSGMIMAAAALLAVCSLRCCTPERSSLMLLQLLLCRAPQRRGLLRSTHSHAWPSRHLGEHQVTG